MSHFFRNLLQGEPHSLQEISNSLEFAAENRTDVISLLEEHHDFLEESIEILMGDDETDSDRQLHLIRFFRLLRMHARAEEESLYVHLKGNFDKLARLEGHLGQDEHDIAHRLEEELHQMGYQTQWNEEIDAKARVVAGLVKNHIKEEETRMFEIAEKDMSDTELENMRLDYLERCRHYLDVSEFFPVQGPHGVKPTSSGPQL